MLVRGRISRVPRLGLEKPSLSIEDSYRNRTRSRCSRVNKTRNRNRTRSYGSCSNSLGIGAIFQRFYRGKWSLRLEIPSLSTLDSESDSESVSMLRPVQNRTRNRSRISGLVSISLGIGTRKQGLGKLYFQRSKPITNPGQKRGLVSKLGDQQAQRLEIIYTFI